MEKLNKVVDRVHMLTPSEEGQQNQQRRQTLLETLHCGCRAYNPYSLAPVDEHGCCLCHDTGFVRISGLRPGDMDFGRAVPCPKHRASGQKVEPELGGFYEMVGVPKRYRGVEFSDFDPADDRMALTVAKGYVKAWPPAQPFLTFQSENKGNGKTMLAVSVIMEAHRRHRVNSRFYPVIDLLERYRQAYQNEETLDKIDAKLRRVPLLVLDDLGAEKGTEWTRERLFSLINARYNDLAATLVTTNVDPGAFDERIASRLLDSRTGKVVIFAGKDRRAA